MTQCTWARLALACGIGIFTASGAQADVVGASDGSTLVRWSPRALDLVTDGTSNTLRFTETTRLGICVGGVTFPGAPASNPVTDGSSNTLMFGESSGFDVDIWRIFTSRAVSDIADGSSNTILLGEGPQQPATDAFCLSGVTPRRGVVDGTSNTIVFGEEAVFDICVDNARIGVRDGTSNTIVFGEVVPRSCFDGVRVGEAATGVPEPAMLSLLSAATAGLVVRRRLWRRARGATACR